MPKIGWKEKKKLKFSQKKIFKKEEISWKEELSHPCINRNLNFKWNWPIKNIETFFVPAICCMVVLSSVWIPAISSYKTCCAFNWSSILVIWLFISITNDRRFSGACMIQIIFKTELCGLSINMTQDWLHALDEALYWGSGTLCDTLCCQNFGVPCKLLQIGFLPSCLWQTTSKLPYFYNVIIRPISQI